MEFDRQTWPSAAAPRMTADPPGYQRVFPPAVPPARQYMFKASGETLKLGPHKCVKWFNWVTGNRATTDTWRAGPKVQGNCDAIAQGTGIATFVKNRNGLLVYPGGDTMDKHVAIFDCGDATGIWVWDHWGKAGASHHHIPFARRGHANNGSAYYVLLVPLSKSFARSTPPPGAKPARRSPNVISTPSGANRPSIGALANRQRVPGGAWAPSTRSSPPSSAPRGGPTRPGQIRPGRAHVVLPGESLWTIAARYRGNGYAWPALAQLNGIGAPYYVYLNQTIALPADWG
jgi:hypothetical protein